MFIVFSCNHFTLFALCKPHQTHSRTPPRRRLTVLDELDCSFNEIEALPSSIGQCACIRTFAADHNFLVQLPPEVRARACSTHRKRPASGRVERDRWKTALTTSARFSPSLSFRWGTGRTRPCCSCTPTSWSPCPRRWATCRS